MSYIDHFMCDYAHNGAAPELIAEEYRFIVRLLKAPIERSS